MSDIFSIIAKGVFSTLFDGGRLGGMRCEQHDEVGNKGHSNVVLSRHHPSWFSDGEGESYRECTIEMAEIR